MCLQPVPEPWVLHWWCCWVQVQLHPAVHRYFNIWKIVGNISLANVFGCHHDIWLQGKASGCLNNCPLRFIVKISSGLKDTPPLPLCDTQICLMMEVENIFRPSCVLFDKKTTTLECLGANCPLRWVVFGKFTELWVVKGCCLSQGGNRVLETFPVCMLPVPQKGKSLTMAGNWS